MVNLKLNFYKPNKDESKGAAIQFDYGKNGLFIELARQKGEKLPPRTKGQQFAWDSKVKIRLEQLEIAKIIKKVLRKEPGELKSFHDNEKSTSSLSVSSYNDGLSFRVGNKSKEEGAQLNAVQTYLDADEAFLLAKFLEEVLRDLFIVRFTKE